MSAENNAAASEATPANPADQIAPLTAPVEPTASDTPAVDAPVAPPEPKPEPKKKPGPKPKPPVEAPAAVEAKPPESVPTLPRFRVGLSADWPDKTSVIQARDDLEAWALFCEQTKFTGGPYTKPTSNPRGRVERIDAAA